MLQLFSFLIQKTNMSFINPFIDIMIFFYTKRQLYLLKNTKWSFAFRSFSQGIQKNLSKNSVLYDSTTIDKINKNTFEKYDVIYMFDKKKIYETKNQITTGYIMNYFPSLRAHTYIKKFFAILNVIMVTKFFFK